MIKKKRFPLLFTKSKSSSILHKPISITRCRGDFRIIDDKKLMIISSTFDEIPVWKHIIEFKLQVAKRYLPL